MKSVLITGTSSGMGLSMTVALARRGWTVHATMRDLSRRTELEQRLSTAGVSQNVTTSALDVSDPKSVETAMGALLADPLRAPFAVIHNAGIAVGGAFEDINDADHRRVMEVNFFGVLALTRNLLPIFRQRRSGRIVLISSESAFAGQPTNAIYCASKWALEGWAESIAYELAPFGIDVVLVEPGPYKTGIWEASPRISPMRSPYAPFVNKINTSVVEHVSRNARDPEEVAEVVVHVLETKKPKFRYPVGLTAKVGHFMRGKVPSVAIRNMVQRYLGVHGMGWK